MNCWAIIVAGGRGSRFGADTPKQYLPLAGRPLLCWSLEAFARSTLVEGIVVVVEEGRQAEVRALAEEWRIPKVQQICAGGDQRSDSVLAGLRCVPPEGELVAVHDAARPLVSTDLIARVIEEAARTGAAIPVLSVRETIKEAVGELVARTVDRSTLRAAQTPQVFRTDLLRRALSMIEPGVQVTDDAQAMELAGHKVALVEGEKLNLKITVAEDLAAATAWMKADWMKEEAGSQMTNVRTGQGYDAHRLIAGRKLILGGVEIPFAQGLLGHSDADVLAHAIGDALLGAAALGDLGQHFPDSAPEFKGICSLDLLARIRRLLDKRGWEIVNIDSTVVAQRPKLAPFIPQMRAKLAASLGLTVEQVNVKATTTEGMGWTGDGQGIAAQAVGTVLKTQKNF